MNDSFSGGKIYIYVVIGILGFIAGALTVSVWLG